MLRLETLGGLALTDNGEERPQPRRRLALLARLAAPGGRGASRDELLGLFWPERDVDSARHSLDQLLYETRRALGAAAEIGGPNLRLDPAVISCDLTEWEAALRRDDLTAAVALYRGPFLQGFFLNGSTEFGHWVDTVRAQTTAAYRHTLESLATAAAARGELRDSLAWWQLLVADDRVGSRAALGLMRALADCGDRAGALEFFRVHERVVRAELDSPPDPTVSAFAHSLQSLTARPTNAIQRTLDIPATATAAEKSTSLVVTPTHSDSQTAAPESNRRRSVLRRLPYAAGALAGVAAVLIGVAILARQRLRTPIPTTDPHETASIAAHELYVRAGDPVLLRSDSGVLTSIGYLRRAVALDPNYAAAYATLASRYTTAAWGSQITVPERHAMRAHAEAAARLAVALDDSLADAHAELGYVLAKVSYDESGAVTEVKKAVSLDSTAAASYELLAAIDDFIGRPDEAIAAARVAVTRNPLTPTANAELGHALYFGGRYDEALAILAPLASLRPPLRRVPVYLGEIYLTMGRWSDAVSVLRPVANKSSYIPGLYAYALVRLGARAEATRLLKRMLAGEPAGLATSFDIAEAYVALGDYDEAFVWLDRSFDDYSLGASIMGPLFARLRADPRFDHIRRRLRIPRDAGG